MTTFITQIEGKLVNGEFSVLASLSYYILQIKVRRGNNRKNESPLISSTPMTPTVVNS
jgi:hypothetical protein